MDVCRTFHMNGGLGDTSYARNSSLQRGHREMVKHVILDAIVNVYTSLSPQCLTIADLGCSSGPNAFLLAEDVVGEIEEVCQKLSHPVPEFLVYLNDLPSNDFNSIFVGVPEFIDKVVRGKEVDGSSLFLVGVPGSFYGRLFPTNSLHVIHSSYSLHWLSQGEIEEEKFDSYNAHFYGPSLEEIEAEVNREGSFTFDHLEAFEGKSFKENVKNARIITMNVRAIQEPLLRHHFREAIIEELFQIYNELLESEMAQQDIKAFSIILVLRKLV